LAALAVADLRKRYGGHVAVDGVDLDVAEGELFCLLGPSGCGKTTLLRLIGGYAEPDAGTVAVGGEDVTSLPLERRNIGMVFQSYALFPHMTARQNVAFGLAARRVPRAERAQRVERMLDRVGLNPATRGRRPRSLSGGEQQRVAIARALVVEPRLLLLDEPLASLDRRLREAMRRELKALQQRTGVATVMVTHDQEDALFLADRIGVMAGGRLLQVGTPDELYDRPRLPFVARFLGDANILPVTSCGAGWVELAGSLRVPTADLRGREGGGDGGAVLVRPERLLVAASAPPDRAAAAVATVEMVTFLGADRQIELVLPGTNGGGVLRLLARVRPEAVPPVRAGDRLFVGVAPRGAWRLPEADPGEQRHPPPSDTAGVRAVPRAAADANAAA
jgi:ABC-type Fe3+/spermidine/putrescine transport system ATPase subunit